MLAPAMKHACYLPLLCLALAGCGTPTERTTRQPVAQDIPQQKPAPVIAAKDRILFDDRTALAAMRRGDFAEAKTLLDSAIARIANIMGEDKAAKQSRSYFSTESEKTFIGEPYERVMAYYYRGILYWADGEPDNARACFRSAMVEDSDTRDKTYAADYALLEFLDALATIKLGGDGHEALARAETHAKRSPLPSLKSSDNVLVFVDFGIGPMKYAAGEYSQHLMFRPGNSTARSAIVKVDDGQQAAATACDDLYFQATTRGGRAMDHILANKAGFKHATDVAGDVAIVSGAVLAQEKKTQTAAIGVASVGVLSKIVSASTTPQADVRTWDNLPLFIGFASLELPPGRHTLNIEFLDPTQHCIPGLAKTITVEVVAEKDSVVYLSDKSSTPLTF
jgi:hypothetical protein